MSWINRTRPDDLTISQLHLDIMATGMKSAYLIKGFQLSIRVALSPLLPHDPWAIGLGVLTAMLLSNLMHADDGAKVAGYICGLILLAHGTEPWSYAFYRLIETILGIVVAGLISLAPKLIRVDESDRGST